MFKTRLRALAVEVCATAVCAAVAAWVATGLTWADAHSFDTALPALAAVALLACAFWAWTVTTSVVVEALRDPAGAGIHPVASGSTGPSPLAPAWIRRMVLAACGVVLVGTVQVSPVHAAPGGPTASAASAPDRRAPGALTALTGLSLPDRTTGGLTRGPLPPLPERALVVAPGDSLWNLATRALPAGASTGDVAGLVARLYDHNRSRIGSDPDLIQPGSVLRMPPAPRPTR